jgi:hypothetical protein
MEERYRTVERGRDGRLAGGAEVHRSKSLICRMRVLLSGQRAPDHGRGG